MSSRDHQDDYDEYYSDGYAYGYIPEYGYAEGNSDDDYFDDCDTYILSEMDGQGTAR